MSVCVCLWGCPRRKSIPALLTPNTPLDSHYANAWRATGDHHDDWDNTANIIEEVCKKGMGERQNGVHLTHTHAYSPRLQLANIAQYAGCFDDKYGRSFSFFSLNAFAQISHLPAPFFMALARLRL